MESLILNRSSISNGGPGSGPKPGGGNKLKPLKNLTNIPDHYKPVVLAAGRNYGIEHVHEGHENRSADDLAQSMWEAFAETMGESEAEKTVVKEINARIKQHNSVSNSSSSLTLVANFSGNVRRETINGRKFIIAPLTMIVPGVLNGSQGPLLYPADEVANSTPYWEGVILTDDHLPNGVNGRKIKTHQEYAMGYVQSPHIKNGVLKAEGWFDVDKTRRINPAILKALEQGTKIELSTGLNVDFDNTSGIHNGTAYNQVVRKYRPDHLAVLINKRGACSIAHGCGVNNMKADMLDQDDNELEDFDLDIEHDDDIDNSWSDAAREAAQLVRKSQAKHYTELADIHSKAAEQANEPGADSAEMHYKAMDAHKQAANAHFNLGQYSKSDYHNKMAKQHRKAGEKLAPLYVRYVSNEQDELDTEDFDLDIEQYDDVYNAEVNNTWSDEARRAAQLSKKAHAASKNLGSGKTEKTPDNLQAAHNLHAQAADAYHNLNRFVSPAKADMIHEKVAEHQDMMRHHYAGEAPKYPSKVKNVFAADGKLDISDKNHVAGAVAALGKGFRGNKVQLSSADRAKAIKRVRAAWLKFNPDKTEADLPPVLKNASVGNAWSDAARKAAALTRKARNLSSKAYASKEGSPAYMKYHLAAEAAHVMASDAHISLEGKKSKQLASMHSEEATNHALAHNDYYHKIYKDKVKNGTTLPTDASGKVIKKKTKKSGSSQTDCSYKEVTNNTKEHIMLTYAQKNELIDNVINNCDCYNEDDREELESLDDHILNNIADGVKAKAKPKKEITVANSEGKTVTKPIDLKSLPVEVQQVLNYGAVAMQRDKETMIDRIVKNAGVSGDPEKAMREKLAKKDLAGIQEIVELLPVEKVDNSVFDFNRLVGNYSGAAAGGFKVANESGPAGGQLGMPEIKWGKN